MAVFLVTTVALYLGVPLIGWGLDRLGGFFSNGARLAYALVVVAFALAVGVQAIDSPEGIRGGRGEEGKLVRRQSAVRIAMILLFYAMLVFLPFSDRHGIGVWAETAPVRWGGVALCGIGYALVFLSGLALGKQYSQEVTIQPGHRLIVTGVFGRIRNPRYLGVILGAIGLSCLFRSWIGLFVSAGVILILLLRIRDEEALMHKEFGQEWEEYCRRSWRLVPYVY
jgi:protein-S-isoprenylcysteine O-methyltransferase Ste14